MYLQWEVWRVMWPFENGQTMERYALLFSPNSFNRTGEAPYFIKISTRDHPEAISKIFVAVGDWRFAGCNLPKDSYFYPGKVKRLSHPDTLWMFGSIPKLGQEVVIKEIMRVTGMPS